MELHLRSLATRWILSGLTLFSVAAIGMPQARSQEAASPDIMSCQDVKNREESEALQRAQNLARQAAESANGGLGRYQAEEAMFNSRAASETATCQFDRAAQLFTFRFLGGEPGWVQKGLQPRIESVVSVTASKPPEISVDYNGPIRAQ
jgi:hypothetical protein